MEEIKAGEYIRTKNGTINQIKRIVPFYENNKLIFYESYVDTENFKEWKVYQLASILKKHSPNIIDLIEEGDYVNGSEVINITEAKRMNPNLPIVKVIEIERDYGMMEEYEPTQVLEHEIESIVTHEEFKNMKYVVGGKEE